MGGISFPIIRIFILSRVIQLKVLRGTEAGRPQAVMEESLLHQIPNSVWKNASVIEISQFHLQF